MVSKVRHQCQWWARWSTAIGLFVAASALAPGVGHALEGPGAVRPAEPEPAHMKVGNWSIQAERLDVEGPRATFYGAVARLEGTERWTLAAQRLVVVSHRVPMPEVRWLWATGDVRLLGPHDLYVMASQLVSVQPERWLEIDQAKAASSLVGADWRLPAARVQIDLRRTAIHLYQIPASASGWPRATNDDRHATE